MCASSGGGKREGHGSGSRRVQRQVPRAFAQGDAMNYFIGRHPVWALIILIAIAALLFLIFAVWPPEIEQLLGRKRIFLSALLNGITLGGLWWRAVSR
jgi:hypothetical protein